MNKITPFTSADVEIQTETTVYDGFFQIKQLSLKHRLFAGEWSGLMQRELFSRRPVGAVLPYDPIRDEVVLIQQFRVGSLTQENPWLLELVAGITELNESVEDMIHREAQEEAGIELLELVKLFQYWVSPGGSSEKLTLYCGRVDATHANGIHGLEEENEDIKVITMPAQQAIDAIKTGAINNAATIIALQWLAMNKETVFSTQDQTV
jgi:ADP-ribose pyrophosphatase